MLGTEGADGEGAPAVKKSRKPAGDLLGDDRFKALFENTAFTIDEQSEEYKALHPNAGAHHAAVLFSLCHHAEAHRDWNGLTADLALPKSA